MLNKLLSVLLILLISYLQTGWAQSPESLFQSANKAYDDQQYDSAFALYEQIEQQGWISAELYQNMGTAAYKQDMVPESIYYFEKGLKLHPGNDDLEHNLLLAQKKITDKGAEVASPGILGWISASVGEHADFWATMSVLFSLIGGLLIAITLFIEPFKKLLRTLGFSAWLLCVFFLAFAAIQNNVRHENHSAILFSPSVNVRTEPSEEASIAFVLHEGSKVEVLGENDQWLRISFGKNKVGWILKSSGKII